MSDLNLLDVYDKSSVDNTVLGFFMLFSLSPSFQICSSGAL